MAGKKIPYRSACPYCFWSYSRQQEGKEQLPIEKKGDRFTIILKGNELEVNRKLRFISRKCREYGTQLPAKEFPGFYQVEFGRNSFVKMNKLMQELRDQDVVVHHAYQPAGNKSTAHQITDRLIIRFREGVSEEKISALISRYNLKRISEFDPYSRAQRTLLLEVTKNSGKDKNDPGSTGKNPVKIADLLNREEIVELAEVSLVYHFPKPAIPKKTRRKKADKKPPVGKRKATPKGPETQGDDFVPTDTLFNKQWHLHAGEEKKNGVVTIKKGADINALEAWKLLRGGGDEKIVIAVLDLELDFNHPDLKNKLSDTIANIKREFVFKAGQVTNDMLIGDHGTKCAGIAVAEKNGEGAVGIAYGCKLLPVWLDPDGVEDKMVRAFNKVAGFSHVISFSQSPEPGKMEMGIMSKVLAEIAESGGPHKKGCVICVSAGNYQVPVNGKIGKDTEVFQPNGSEFPLKKGQDIFNLYAAHPSVIAVTASTSLNTIAAYNNFGEEISVCAPSADWELESGMGDLTTTGIYTTASSDGNVGEGKRYTKSFCGTSAAAPMVAGVAALVLSANKDLPAGVVKAILQKTADKINPADAKYDTNGHSELYGFGKVNAGKAVKMALDLKKKNTGKSNISLQVYLQQIGDLIA